MSHQVIIDSADNVIYKSFYIKALVDCFGAKSISYSSKPFIGLSDKARSTWSILFVVDDGTASTKYVISLNFASTLWYSNEWNKNDEGVNLRRANFIRACRAISSVHFEGGLVSQGSDRSSEKVFADCLWGG